jgi:hypothetical protein
LKFGNSNCRITTKLLLLDLLTSCMVTWEDFFKDLRRIGIVQNLKWKSLTELAEDLDDYKDFSNEIRDMNACISYLLDSIEFDMELSERTDRRWKRFRFEVETLKDALSNTADDFANKADLALQHFLTKSAQTQSESSMGLTVIAAIFLPLGLASSILSMSTHVSKIGDIWYDWIGLWFVMGFICASTFLLWRIIRETMEGKDTLLLNALLSMSKFTQLLFFFPFFAVVSTSFAIGMFHSKQVAAAVLKIGLPSAIGFSVFIMVLTRIGKITRYFWHGIVLFGRDYYRVMRETARATKSSPQSQTAEESRKMTGQLFLISCAANPTMRQRMVNNPSFLLGLLAGTLGYENEGKELCVDKIRNDLREIAAGHQDIEDLMADACDPLQILEGIHLVEGQTQPGLRMS